MASIYQRQNGTYCVRVYYGVHNGVQKVVSKTYFPPAGMSPSLVKKDLERFARSFEDMVRSGSYVPGARVEKQDARSMYMTLGEFIPGYYLPKIKSKMSPNTVRFYESVINQIILPSYGDVRLVDIRKSHLQVLIDYLATSRDARADGKPLSLAVPTIKRYVSVFRSVMKEALNQNFITDNPFEHGEPDYPKDTRPKRRDARLTAAYGVTELRRFLIALRSEEPLSRILLLSSVVLGVRRAELVALRWEDVDFDLKCLYVDKSAYKLKGEKQALKSPKTEQGYRDVFFPEIYKNELLAWREEQSRRKTEAGDRWNEQGFIFTNTVGDMVSLYRVTELCADFEKRNEIRHLKLHGLRHTFDSILNSKGVGLETIKELMGHKSIKTTEIYTHALIEDKIEAANKMNEILKVFEESEVTESASDHDASADRTEVSGA